MKRKWIFFLAFLFLISILPISLSPYLPIGVKYAEPAGTQKIVKRTAVSIAATGTTFDTAIEVYPYSNVGARATRYILECPDMTGNGTTTLSIIDANGVMVYAGAAHAENANYSIPIDVELVGVYTIRLTLSIAAGDATTAYITILGE
jgi:hypothetical protein